MKKQKKASSIVEAVIILLIVVSATTGVYVIFVKSQELALTTKNKITAIQIAREGIEGITNIRDTNSILFAASLKNCWNTMNYNSACLLNSSTTLDIAPGSYILSPDTNNRWILTSTGTSAYGYTDPLYRTRFQVSVDGNGFYTQSGGVSTSPLFTRELIISYIDTNGGGTDSNDEKMKIQSKISWIDNSGDKHQELTLDTILTNWKN